MATFTSLLLSSGALRFGDFTLKSGRKCPYFLNFGAFNTGKLLAELGEHYAATLKKLLTSEDAEKNEASPFTHLFGPAYKGIPLATVTATALYKNHNLDVGVTYNRKEPKNHGEGGQLIGAEINENSKVMIIDDVITAGTALRESLELLKKTGNPKIAGVIIAVDREEKGQGDKSSIQEIKEQFGINIYSIVTLDDIISHLTETLKTQKPLITPTQLEAIREYRKLYGPQ